MKEFSEKQYNKILSLAEMLVDLLAEPPDTEKIDYNLPEQIIADLPGVSSRTANALLNHNPQIRTVFQLQHTENKDRLGNWVNGLGKKGMEELKPYL